MKKLLIPLITVLLIFSGLFLWQKQSYSETNLPYPEPPTSDNPPKCVQSVVNQMTLMRNAWNQNLETMMDQEKPCSEMVDEAFESMRTYRCWLDYLCETVLFSANSDPAIEKNQKMTSSFINRLPGCAKPENIEIPDTSLKYLDSCRVGTGATARSAEDNYNSCRKLVNMDFSEVPNPAKGSKDSTAVEAFKNQSQAFIKVERLLKQCSVNQKNKILEDKLTEFLGKMFTMESHLSYLKEQMQSFSARLPCLAEKCT